MKKLILISLLFSCVSRNFNVNESTPQSTDLDEISMLEFGIFAVAFSDDVGGLKQAARSNFALGADYVEFKKFPLYSQKENYCNLLLKEELKPNIKYQLRFGSIYASFENADTGRNEIGKLICKPSRYQTGYMTFGQVKKTLPILSIEKLR